MSKDIYQFQSSVSKPYFKFILQIIVKKKKISIADSFGLLDQALTLSASEISEGKEVGAIFRILM